MARYAVLGDHSQAERIRQLEEQLWAARRTIVELAPEPLARELANYLECQSESDFWDWKRKVIDTVIDAARSDPAISHFQPRAWCPLCRGGSSGPYDSGYSKPEGLRRHLEGHGNTAECPVTSAAFWLARVGLRSRFDADQRDKEARLAERRRTERLFLTDPNEPPRLLEERLSGWNNTLRDAVASEMAEQRLRALGFVLETNGNVVAWRFHHEDWTVLGDARAAGRISCVVFRTNVQPVAIKGRPRKKSGPITASFDLLDTWKLDLPGKFRRQLEKAVRSLEARGVK